MPFTMIPAIFIGRKGSQGLPGKNLLEVNGFPLASYPMAAVKSSKYVDVGFLSTDDPKLEELGHKYGFESITRPSELATSEALGEDVFKHAFKCLESNLENIEVVVLLFCNSATLNSSIIDSCIEMLRNNPSADSVVTVSKYNMWSPLRARKENKDGYLEPFVPFKVFGDPATLNCDRDSQGDVWFADMSVSVVRPHCIHNMDSGLLPQKWMGRKILPYKQECGCDVDYIWQVPMVKWWLDNECSSQ